MNKNNPSLPVATVSDFTTNYLEIRENTILSRVELVIKDQHLQITLDHLDQSQDLFVEVLGFEQTQTLHSPASTWQTTIATETVSFPGQDFNLERQGFGFVDVEWRRQGQTWAQARANTQNQLVYIPNRTYTAKSLTEALNDGIAEDIYGRLEDDGRASIMVNVEVVTGTDNDPSDATVTIDATADSASHPSLAAR